MSQDRTPIALTDKQWRALEDVSRTLPPGDAILDFWRMALRLSVAEWDRLPRSAFSVTDYELTLSDYERLRGVLLMKARSRQERSRVEWVLLDMGPVAIQD